MNLSHRIEKIELDIRNMSRLEILNAAIAAFKQFLVEEKFEKWVIYITYIEVLRTLYK